MAGLEEYMSNEAMCETNNALSKAREKSIKDLAELKRCEVGSEALQENTVFVKNFETGEGRIETSEKIDQIEDNASYLPFGWVDSQSFESEKEFKRTKDFYQRYQGNAQTILALQEHFTFQNLGEREKVLKVAEAVAGLKDFNDEEFQNKMEELRAQGLNDEDIFNYGMNAILGAERAMAAIPPEYLSSEYFEPQIDFDTGQTMMPAILGMVVTQGKGKTEKERLSFVVKTPREEATREVAETKDDEILPPY